MNSRQAHAFSFRFFSIRLLILGVVLATPAASQSEKNLAPPRPEVQSQAEQGDTSAQYEVASSLFANNLSLEEMQHALKWLRAATAQNNADAEFVLGYMYEHGVGVARDYTVAFQNYQAAAVQHHAGAENNLASLYQNGLGVKKNAAKAFGWYLVSAQQGDPVAQCNLAALYYAGSGTRRDQSEAFRWLRASAESDLPDAQLHLSYFYFYGIVVPQDYNEAARLVRLAARSGLPQAEASMGLLFEQGKGVPLDYVSAYTWYSRAAAVGDHFSRDRRKQLAQLMTRKQLDEANALITVSSGHPPSQRTSLTTAASSLLNH
jgi:TPR repeat protein